MFLILSPLFERVFLVLSFFFLFLRVEFLVLFCYRILSTGSLGPEDKNELD